MSTLFLTTILKSKTKLPYNILYMAKVHSTIIVLIIHTAKS